jgi:hypothetical protein
MHLEYTDLSLAWPSQTAHRGLENIWFWHLLSVAIGVQQDGLYHNCEEEEDLGYFVGVERRQGYVQLDYDLSVF